MEGQVRYYLDQAGQVPLRPDIVWKIGGTTAAVIDAKYKAEKPAGYPNADLYQLLAYCTILGLPVGHLVYAPRQRIARPARRPSVRRRDPLPRHRPQPAAGPAHRADERPCRTRHRYGDYLLSVSGLILERRNLPFGIIWVGLFGPGAEGGAGEYRAVACWLLGVQAVPDLG